MLNPKKPSGIAQKPYGSLTKHTQSHSLGCVLTPQPSQKRKTFSRTIQQLLGEHSIIIYL